MAVATFESVFLIPHLAKIDVSPANIAEPNAKNIHILSLLFIFVSEATYPSMRTKSLIQVQLPTIPDIIQIFRQ